MLFYQANNDVESRFPTIFASTNTKIAKCLNFSLQNGLGAFYQSMILSYSLPLQLTLHVQDWYHVVLIVSLRKSKWRSLFLKNLMVEYCLVERRV